MDDTEFARFMSHVEVGECWLWTGTLSRTGYGQFYLRKKTRDIHRLMLERVLGRALGEGMHTLHSCRNKHCVRPEHLREGTQQENMEDRTRDGNTHHILTEDQVRAIRADTRIERVIAPEYGVSRATIGQIRRGQTWKHI